MNKDKFFKRLLAIIVCDDCTKSNSDFCIHYCEGNEYDHWDDDKKQMFLALFEMIDDRCSDIGTLKSEKCDCPIADDIEDDECYFHEKMRKLENAAGKPCEVIKAIYEECKE